MYYLLIFLSFVNPETYIGFIIYIVFLVGIAFFYIKESKNPNFIFSETKEKEKEVSSQNEKAEKNLKPENKTISKKEKNAVLKEPVIAYEAKKEETVVKEKVIPVKETKNPKTKEDPIRKSGETKFVNYVLDYPECEDFFPIIKIPKTNCVVRSHRYGTSKRRGYKEEIFQKALHYFFSEHFEVSGNVRFNTGPFTNPYEPDIALISLSSKNIRIDIEIDEPYAGITRQPTHCFGDDCNRDTYFKERGWMVLRFSEYQVHTQEKECIRLIADLINAIDKNFNIPEELQLIGELKKEKVWDLVKAQNWEKERYREFYLNHEFGRLEEKVKEFSRRFDEQELKEELLVKSSFFGRETKGKEVGCNKSNAQSKDKRIKFFSEKHVYTIDGVPAPSASTIVNKFFPEFDTLRWSYKKAQDLGKTPEEVAKMWKRKGEIARDEGIFLHEQIERYFLGLDHENTKEFYQFQKFFDDHSDLKPFRTEWRIFDEDLHIAGTIDFVASTDQGYQLYDWKRSRKVVASNGEPIKRNQWQCGIGKLNHIDDTSYNKYCLQQSLYKYILEKSYDIKIEGMYLIIMHPVYENYFKVNVPYRKKEIDFILSTL